MQSSLIDVNLIYMYMYMIIICAYMLEKDISKYIRFDEIIGNQMKFHTGLHCINEHR